MHLVFAGQHGIWVILFAWGFAVMAALQPSSSFVHTQCAGHRPIYAPLIEHQLSRYRFGEPMTVEGVLQLIGDRNSSKSQILVVNNVVFTRVAPYGNMQTYYIPLFRKLTGKAVLPDLMLASNLFDLPEDDIARRGGPWFGYCNVPFLTTNLLLPAREGVSSHLHCGTNCEPFTNLDRRKGKAIFLGSSTGWASGHRQGAILAGILHNESVYSGYTKIIDLPAEDTIEEDHLALPHETKPKMSLADQVKGYKYIINADGHCAALRLRQLLASDCVVLWIESNQIEWFYPLLQPFVHYIPVRFDAQEAANKLLPDLIEKIAWAEANPKTMANIVHNANKFATTHLSEHALSCYSLQLLDDYARLFSDAHKLKDIVKTGGFKHIHKHT